MPVPRRVTWTHPTAAGPREETIVGSRGCFCGRESSSGVGVRTWQGERREPVRPRHRPELLDVFLAERYSKATQGLWISEWRSRGTVPSTRSRRGKAEIEISHTMRQCARSAPTGDSSLRAGSFGCVDHRHGRFWVEERVLRTEDQGQRVHEPDLGHPTDPDCVVRSLRRT